LGLGAWGLGFGVLAQPPNPQSPIPNPHSLSIFKMKLINFVNYLNNLKLINKFKITKDIYI
jgi:hypothetical protein